MALLGATKLAKAMINAYAGGIVLIVLLHRSIHRL